MTRRTLPLLLVAALIVPVFAQQRQPARPGEQPQRPLLRPPPRLPEGVAVHRDLQYAQADAKANRLDLFVPRNEGGKPLPLVIWVHGGAWRAGTKNNCPALPLLSEGYAVASVEYRLSQVAIWPAQIHDCKAAIRYLRANAAKYGLDPQRFGSWGGSAGGHLSAMIAVSGEVKELEGDLGHADQSSRVQCAVNWFGPSNLQTMQSDSDKNAFSRMRHDGPNSPESLLIGGDVMKDKDKAASASPITYVSKDDCPMLHMHGDKDPIVPPQQSQVLHDALTKAGVASTLVFVEGAGHGFRGPDHIKRVREFFDKHLKK
ncbi:MAG: Carboxylesterase NlhH [Planctomycetes bacterium ADurb.Bin126]|nr:MAG: Carboxylesterase NlhH [Planctomycetes bacterium ADurb.Bin126]HOD81387.1 alpha/beta hydrolase [Phycisphaerae bacterium]HQL76284.1 alpha/beta hydrolase [Phycisphaerae bacterium]